MGDAYVTVVIETNERLHYIVSVRTACHTACRVQSVLEILILTSVRVYPIRARTST